MECPEDLVDNRVAEYFGSLSQGMVDTGERSPSARREIHRSAQHDEKDTRGAWSYGFWKNAQQSGNGTVEDWHRWAPGSAHDRLEDR